MRSTAFLPISFEDRDFADVTRAKNAPFHGDFALEVGLLLQLFVVTLGDFSFLLVNDALDDLLVEAATHGRERGGCCACRCSLFLQFAARLTVITATRFAAAALNAAADVAAAAHGADAAFTTRQTRRGHVQARDAAARVARKASQPRRRLRPYTLAATPRRGWRWISRPACASATPTLAAFL